MNIVHDSFVQNRIPNYVSAQPAKVINDYGESANEPNIQIYRVFVKGSI